MGATLLHSSLYMAVTLPLYTSLFLPNPLALSGLPLCTLNYQQETDVLSLTFNLQSSIWEHCFSSRTLFSEELFSTRAAAGVGVPFWDPEMGGSHCCCTEGIVNFRRDLLTKQGHGLNNAMQRHRGLSINFHKSFLTTAMRRMHSQSTV